MREEGMYATQGKMSLEVSGNAFTISYAHTGLFTSAADAHNKKESSMLST